MAKGQVVRGTPVTHVPPGGAAQQGIAPGIPKDMNGTTSNQYGAEQSGYRIDPRSGTAYQSEAGNPGDAMRTAEGTGRYGMVRSEGGHDHNDPHSNGEGTILDGANRYQDGYTPKAAPTMDSPVPMDAPIFDTGTIHEEDRAHMGTRNESGARDDLMKVGGVMSR